MFEEQNAPIPLPPSPNQKEQQNGPKPPVVFNISFNKNSMLMGLAVLAVIVTGILVFSNSNFRLGFGGSPETIAKKAVDYINTIQNQEATLLSFSEESGVIKIRISIGGREFDSYVTKDSKLLFPEVVKIDSKSAGVSQDNESLEKIRPVTAEDHIRGDANAPVKIVEYSDTECPFCKKFHETMKQVMDEYGKSGKVAWVYRHFPLDNLHPKARKESEALECAFELGGNNAFWAYTDRIYEVTPSNNGLDELELPKIAQYVGISATAFNNCLSSGKHSDKIQADVENANATGGNGTPWSIVVAKNGKKFPISGAQPYSDVKKLIESALLEE